MPAPRRPCFPHVRAARRRRRCLLVRTLRAVPRGLRILVQCFPKPMLWVKSLHVIFVVSWFAGLFYLPRIIVNLALETDPTARARLLTMGRKLFRFTTILAVPAVLFGAILFAGYGIGLRGPGNGWMHAKLLLVICVIGYHH